MQSRVRDLPSRVVVYLLLAACLFPEVGTIGRRVLANLMLDRRSRACPRIVKRAISKYQARAPNIDRTSYKSTVRSDILAGESPGPANEDP